jgi:sarcosine oxidase subunit beta
VEPALNPSLLGAMLSPLRSQADPLRATRAFATLAARQGARILTHQEVTGLDARAAGGYMIRTSQGELVAGTVVIAAGAWCRRLAALLDLDIPIVPVRGQMWATEPLPPRIFHTIGSAESALAWHRDRGGEPPDLTHRLGGRVTRHLYGRQRVNGEIIFGGDREPLNALSPPGWDRTPDPAGIESNRRHAEEVLPFLAALPVARTWTGLMPFSLDGKPLIGRIPHRENLWIVSGLASSGFGRGPMAGKLLADYLHTGDRPPVLAEADPARCVRESVRAGAR